MTQNTVPIATSIPHHLATEVLDKSAGNWPLWEKRILSVLTIVGLEGYVVGGVPCPDSTADPVGATNWHTNDRAVVSFLTLKSSRPEQEYIAPHAAAGAKAVWDALVTRHFDATLQIRLLREAFSVRYGAEPPAVTSARIDALATRILALGPINKATLVSAAMVNAVQGDLENFTTERRRATSRPLRQDADLAGSAEQAAISAIATERSILEDVLSPAVSAFLQSTQGSNEAEWTRLMELLFQVLGRLDAITIVPGWDRAISAKRHAVAEVQKLQSNLESSDPPVAATVDDGNIQALRVSEAERTALASIAAEMSKVRDELAPAVSNYLQQEPDDTQRHSLIQLLVQILVRLDNTAMQPEWEGRIERRRAVEEVLRLLTTLEWLPASESSAGPDQSIGEAEQEMLALIASELSNVQKQSDEKERRDLAKALFETVQRLDSTRINLDWEHARNQRRNVVRAVEKLQTQLEALPSSSEEQDAIDSIEAERSKSQFLLFPAVTAYLGNPNERERMRLSELLFQALERLDAVTLQSGWDKARVRRKDAVNEVQRLQDNLTPKVSSPSYSTSSAQNASPAQGPSALPIQALGEEEVRNLLMGERSKIQYLLSPAVQFYLTKPSEKERARLSELLLQALERLDGIAIEREWEACRQDRRNAVIEVQKLQDMLDGVAPRS
ncbi:BAG domain-containing protein [Mycena venus]|uniref:BAG domain-containing protein n=1 Tax=Mycena venus TaxID=2733690 RepID=A0A8H6YPU3_9AGAR|nr:BAG domain-containing protein [Mycena venus]